MQIRCPEPHEILRLLEEKARLAASIYKWNPARKRYERDAKPIADAALKMFGRLQTTDMSLEPDDRGFLSILYTLPGLLTCYNMYMKEKRGRLQNEVVALEGPGGSGKSTVAYWLTRWLGGVMITPEEDPIAKLIEILEEGRWYPIIVFDDAATYLSKYWFLSRRERDRMIKLFKALEFIRDVTGLLMYTARSFSGVAKKLRELATFVGVYKHQVIGDRFMVDVIEWRRASDAPTMPPRYVDILWPGIKIPDKDFKRQLEQRRKLALEYLVEAYGGRGEG